MAADIDAYASRDETFRVGIKIPRTTSSCEGREADMRTMIAMFSGVVLGASMTVAVRSLSQRKMPEVETVDKCRIAQIASEWFKSRYQNVKLSESVVNGGGVFVSGEVSYPRGVFGTYGLEIFACQTDETIVVRGTCPIEIDKDHMALMRELAVRADFKTRESIATLYLDAGGRLRCRASMPFDALLIDAEESMWMLAASIEGKLLACESAAKRVCEGECSPAEAACGIKEFQLLTADYLHDGSCEYETSRFSAYEGLPPVEDVVKRWFDSEQGYYEMHRDPCTTRFSGFWRYMGDDYFDMVCYRVDIANRTLIGMCHCPLSLQGDDGHDEIVGLVSDFNSRHDRASLKMDLDAGHLATQYEMPVSVLRRPRSQARFGAAAADMTGVPDNALVEIYEKLQWILSAKDEACDCQNMQSGAYMAQGKQSK